MSLEYVIFCTFVVLGNLVVAFGIGALLYRHFRESFAARRNAREFAATLPAEERPAFWRLYKQRRRTT